jgi:long-subunit acyl-CoA synthetase (AMP-forming)
MAYFLSEWDDASPAQLYNKLARQGHGAITSLPVRVIKPDRGERLSDVARNASEIGEVIVKGNLCAKGYYKVPEATRKLFAGGWLHTGDLAVWHPDGAIQIVDRAKDIIISGEWIRFFEDE